MSRPHLDLRSAAAQPSRLAFSRPYLGLDDVSRPSILANCLSIVSVRPLYSSLSTALVRLSLCRVRADCPSVRCSVASRPSLGRLSGPFAAMSWPYCNHLAAVSRSRLTVFTRLTCVKSGCFCVVFARLLGDHLSDHPRLVGCLGRALSAAFEASLDGGCFYSRLSLSLYPVVPNTLQDEEVTKTQHSSQDHQQ